VDVGDDDAAAHDVSPPATLSPRTFANPAAHATHAPDETRWFSAHSVHVVSAPCVSSPGALMYPAAHGAHAPDKMR
jgi:hypothetical protein